MRRFTSIVLLLALLLPFAAVAAQEASPTPEGMEADDEQMMPESSMDVEAGQEIEPFALTATAIMEQATEMAAGAGGGAAQVEATPPAAFDAQAVPPAAEAAPPPGQGGGLGYADGYGPGRYYGQPAPEGYVYHHVRYGENLYRISLRYGVPIYAIQVANPFIRNVNLIYAGQWLLIPSRHHQPYPPHQPPHQPPYQPPHQPEYPPDYCIPIPKGPCLTPTPVIPVTPGTPGPTVPPPTDTDFELGGHVFGYANAADMRNAGMTWAKVQLRWSQGESTASAQAAINEATAEGFNILLSIAGDPEQLRANPQQYYQQFAAYLAQVAALGPDAIEVWNEQNIDREWPNGLISPQSYTQMLSAAYQAIKAANPSVMVISGAPAPTGFFGGACTGTGCDDAPYIQGMAAAGAANYADCIGIHYNEGILPPTATSGDPRQNGTHYTRYYPSMVSLYSTTFPSRPLCFTELGYLSPEGYPPLPTAFDWAQNTTVAQQSQWLAQAAQLSRSSGRIRLMIVWNVNATEYGADPQAGFAIVRPGNTCPACVELNGVMFP